MKKIPEISDAEWQVMKALWERSPQTAAEVVDAIGLQNNWKPKTVMTLLTRLVKKGALDYDKQGRAYLYYPLVEEAACARAEGTSLAQRLRTAAFMLLLAQFVEEAELSDEEIEELKRILDEGKK